MEWLESNKEWFFSGAGVFIISVIVALFIKQKSTNKQVQKSGNNSTNYQSSGDINIGNKND